MGYPMLRSRMNGMPSLFDEDFFSPFFRASGFNVDLRDTGDEYLLEAELPGLARDDIKIDLEDGILTVSAQWENARNSDYLINERRFGRVQRSFSLENVAEDGITANYENGMLYIRLPKREDVRKTSRRIELN